MWIGTTTGMSRYQDGKFTNYTKKQGLLSDVVTSIYEDTDGNIWIATGGGDARPFPHGSRREIFAALVNTGVGYSIRSI